VRLVSGVFTYVGPVLTIPFSYSLVAITTVLVAGRTATWIAYLVLCAYELPELRRKIAFDRSFVKPLMRFGGWMTVSNIVSPVLVYLDRFLIAAVIGATAVAYYVTPFEIVTRLLLLPWAFSGVLFPLIATTFVQSPDRTARLYSRGIRLTYVTLFPIVLVVIAFAQRGLSLWVGDAIAMHSASVMRWLALGVFFNGLVQVPFATIQAAGRPDLTARIHLVELPLYLPTLWWMAHRWGIDGAAIAWMLRGGFDLALQYVVATRLLPAANTQGQQREPGSLLLAAGFPAFAFATVTLAPTMASRATVVVIYLAIFTVIASKRVLDREERSYLRGMVHRATARFRTA